MIYCSYFRLMIGQDGYSRRFISIHFNASSMAVIEEAPLDFDRVLVRLAQSSNIIGKAHKFSRKLFERRIKRMVCQIG